MKLEGVECQGTSQSLILAFHEREQFLAESEVGAKPPQQFVGIYRTTDELAGGCDWLID